MASQENPYHKFRSIFYPDGVREETEFKLLAELIAEGYTDAQVAKFYGVSRITIGNWKSNHEEIRQVWADNQALPIAKVVRSLYEAANGYELMETKTFVSEGRILKEEVLKKVPPDTRAAIFFLTNKDPKNWKTVVTQRNEEVPPAPVFDYSQLTEEEQDKLEELLAKVAPPKPTE